VSNQSADLRFMLIFNSYIQNISGYKIIYKYDYGTPENLTSGIPNKRINNIHDAKYVIENLEVGWKNKLNNKYDANWKKAAVMNIYQDGRDYEFIQEVVDDVMIVTPSSPPSSPSNVLPYSIFSNSSLKMSGIP
jgi:hypothetical protein